MTTSNQIQLKAGEGNAFWVLGDLYTFKVTGKETNGAFTVMDQIIQPQGGPPPHIHHREDEAFFILDGTFSFLCGDKETVFDKGSFVYVPKGVLHTFRNIGEQQGRPRYGYPGRAGGFLLCGRQSCARCRYTTRV